MDRKKYFEEQLDSIISQLTDTKDSTDDLVSGIENLSIITKKKKIKQKTIKKLENLIRDNEQYKTYSYDLLTLNVDENKFPESCHDLKLSTFKLNVKLKQEPDTFLFIYTTSDQNYSALCLTKEDIVQIANDSNNWNYECFRPYNIFGGKGAKELDISKETYVKIPESSILIPLFKLYKILDIDSERILYLVPEKQLNYTSNFSNAYTQPDTFVNNYCQIGTQSIVYDLQICNGENCIISDFRKRWNSWDFL